ncbi:MAG TPA: type II toxin-antitoxin system prevent-host-death family antitoxin [Blastocatellia bacterium]|nr:type II toxin-antitoxin system prevent-host-death family antitoxin [Blastocatellia bacterium]
MNTTTIQLPIIKARDRLTSLPEELAEEPGAIAVTRRGEPVLAILPWELYESIMETLEILSDGELMAALRQSIKEASEDQAVSWDRARQELNRDISN